MEDPSQMDLCAICLGGMGVRDGQAIFMAECSHTFHFHCISSSVAHGHLLCPLCNAPWRELPFVRPAESTPPTQSSLQPPSVDVAQLPLRPPRLSLSVELQRELVLLEATEDIAAARVASERGAHQEAVEILENRRRAVAQSDLARGGDAMIVALEIELREMLGRVSSRLNYARSGQADMHQRSSSSSLGSWSQPELPSVTGITGFHAGEVTTSMEGTHQVSHRVDATLPYTTPATLARLLQSRRTGEAAAEGRLERDNAGEEAEGSEPIESQVEGSHLNPTYSSFRFI